MAEKFILDYIVFERKYFIMSNAVFYCSFNLKKRASVSDFLQAAEKLNNEYISKQKGYISWQQLSDGDMWADFLTFETMEDVKNFEAESGNAGELAEKFYSFINHNSCKVNYFTIEKSY
ncbi:MAG: hypothetical protein LBC82_08595 [Oscillospiraceae bacterium]|nr:hypothetical protein [Oscillospiraceae bacterium]